MQTRNYIPVILYWDILKLFFMELCFLQCICLGLCVCAHVHKHACAHIHVRLYTCAFYGVNEEAIRRITLEPIRVSQAFLRRTLHWYLLLLHEITNKTICENVLLGTNFTDYYQDFISIILIMERVEINCVNDRRLNLTVLLNIFYG